MFPFLQQARAITEYVGVIFFGLIIIETLYHTILKKQSYKDSLANFIIYVIGTFLNKTVYIFIIYFGLKWIKNYAFFEIPSTVLNFIIVIFITDFIYYWMHRWEHEIRILWSSHNVHHSSEEFNLTTSLRISWFNGIYSWLFYIPIVLLGFSFEMIIVALTINQVYGVWTHTEKIKKLGFLEHIFVTPSNHRVHHGSNKKYLDKNYGGILIIWDKFFGTFEPEVEKVKYGLTTSINTYNPIKINLIEIQQMICDFKKAKTNKEAWRYVFGKTGWKTKKINNL